MNRNLFQWVALVLGVLAPSCAMPSIGQSYYRHAQPVEPLVAEIVVISAEPLSQEAAVVPRVPVVAVEASEDLTVLSQSTHLEWVKRFDTRPEIVLDLGVGEAPYDDNDHDYAMDFHPLHGFSDALVQLELRKPFGPGASWHGIAALNRIQEDTLMQAMGDGDWAWFGVGVQWSW